VILAVVGLAASVLAFAAWAQDGTSACSGVGAFGGDAWPSACWRPFADASPFNQELPQDARVAPDSAAIVARIVDQPDHPRQPGNLVIRKDGASGEPTYYARPGDPQFTVTCTRTDFGPCPLEGEQVRIPAGARPEAPTDAHLTVVDQDRGMAIDLWGVEPDLVPATGGELKIAFGGQVPIDGDGLGSWGTAARTSNLAGRIRVEELEAGEIRHALAIVIDCDDGTFVYPALKQGRTCPAPHEDDPPMGTRLRLDLSPAEIEALDAPPWRKTIYRAMARYGMIFMDTGTAASLELEAESGTMYTSQGGTDRWLDFAESADLLETADGLQYVMSFAGDGIDWAHRLDVIKPCVSERRC
jgi:hypothetical protein